MRFYNRYSFDNRWSRSWDINEKHFVRNTFLAFSQKGLIRFFSFFSLNLNIDWDIQAGVGLRPGKFFVCYCRFQWTVILYWSSKICKQILSLVGLEINWNFCKILIGCTCNNYNLPPTIGGVNLFVLIVWVYIKIEEGGGGL